MPLSDVASTILAEMTGTSSSGHRVTLEESNKLSSYLEYLILYAARACYNKSDYLRNLGITLDTFHSDCIDVIILSDGFQLRGTDPNVVSMQLTKWIFKLCKGVWLKSYKLASRDRASHIPFDDMRDVLDFDTTMQILMEDQTPRKRGRFLSRLAVLMPYTSFTPVRAVRALGVLCLLSGGFKLKDDIPTILLGDPSKQNYDLVRQDYTETKKRTPSIIEEVEMALSYKGFQPDKDDLWACLDEMSKCQIEYQRSVLLPEDVVNAQLLTSPWEILCHIIERYPVNSSSEMASERVELAKDWWMLFKPAYLTAISCPKSDSQPCLLEDWKRIVQSSVSRTAAKRPVIRGAERGEV